MRKYLAIVLLFGVSSLFAEKYAVLITGDYADVDETEEGNWAQANPISDDRFADLEEFWSDTFLMWEALLKSGFSDENIFILFADGTDFVQTENCPDWFSDRYRIEENEYSEYGFSGESITDYAATKENVIDVLCNLSGNPPINDGLCGDGISYNFNELHNVPVLSQNDFIYFWTFDYGTRCAGYTPNENNENIYAGIKLLNEFECIASIDFNTIVDSYSCSKKIIFMQQCWAGGFVQFWHEIPNTIIFTADGLDADGDALA